MRLFSYVVARDFGFAPNPFHGTCTLATCKPVFRKAARVGDWVIGTSSTRRGAEIPGDHLIYCMQVDEVLSFDQYWRAPRFQVKKPNLRASWKYQMGDNIYHSEHGAWRQEDSHHSCEGGVLNPNNLRTDTGRTDKVLIGNRFAYWGKEAIPVPQRLRNCQGHDVVANKRGDKSIFPDEVVAAFVEWFEGLGAQGIIGEPIMFGSRKFPRHNG